MKVAMILTKNAPKFEGYVGKSINFAKILPF